MVSTMTHWTAANLSHHGGRNEESERDGAPCFRVTSLIRRGKVENQTSAGKSAKCNEVDRCYLLWRVELALRRGVEDALKPLGLGLECLSSGRRAFVYSKT